MSFIAGSNLQAEELSITIVPASANLGAHSREIFPPAEKKAKSGCFSKASSIEIILIGSSLNSIVFPIDLSEATGNNSVTGKFLCCKICNIISPTIPRSEEHTSELQSRGHLVCRLLLEKKNIYF